MTQRRENHRSETKKPWIKDVAQSIESYLFKHRVMGGAYRIDKMVRLMYGYGWWPDEQPSDEVKRYVESRLDKIEDRLE